MAPKLSVLSWAQLKPRAAMASTTYSLHPTAATDQLVLLLPHISRRGVKYGWSTRAPRMKLHDAFNDPSTGLPSLTTGPAAALLRKAQSTPIRSGALATKKGMTALYAPDGTRTAATVLQLDAVQVVANRAAPTSGYWAVQVGSGRRHPDNETSPMLGYYEAKGLGVKRALAEFRVRGEEGLLPVGTSILPDWFLPGQHVDVRSNTKGKGFAGGMKRWGFKGQGASHGNSLNHRTMGSVGGSQGSGSRVHPGKRMPGRMGNERRTVQNLRVLKVDNEMGIVVVAGHVAGPRGCLVRLQDAIKKPPPPEEHIAAANKALVERTPDAEERYQEARKRHLEMKRIRQEMTEEARVAAAV